MLTLVTRTDVHISDRTPTSRTDDWTATVLRKLKEVGEIATEVGASAVLDNGDFFDIKSPWRNSHSLISAITAVHQESYTCPVHANVGNHDCIYGNIDYLHQQPLEVLFQTGVFERCYNTHEALFESGGVSVRVVGIPYHGESYDMERFRIEKGAEDHLVVMAHLLASAKGGSMFEQEDIVRYEDLPDLCPEASVFLFGHWHKDQGIETLSNGAYVVNVGSLTRGSLSLDDMDRKPAVSVLRFEKESCTAQRRNLTVKPFAEVFDLERKIREENTDSIMAEYVEKMTSILSTEKHKDLRSKVQALKDVPSAVREHLMHLIEEAEAEVR